MMAYTYYKTAEFSGGWHSGRIGVEVESQNVAGNYSVVNLIFQVRKDVSSSSYNNGGAVEYIKLDGTSKVTGDSIDFRSYVIGTWYNVMQALNVVVYHGTDGKKTISVQGYCDTNVGAGVYNQTQSVVLPTIARKSTVSSITSPVSCNGTNAVTVGIARADSSFTHKVTFSLGTASQQYTGVATSQAFTIPLSWLNQITTDIQAVANCRVETFSGSTSLGYVDAPFTITVPSTVVPVVNSITISKVADVFSAGIFAQGISKVQGTGASITNQYGATISEYDWYVTNDLGALGTPYVGATFISGLLAISGTIYVVFKVKDSRGRWSAAYSQAITVYAYTAPTLTVTGERCDAAGIPNPNGEYLKARIQASIPSVNNDNSKVYSLQYKKTSDPTWTTIDVSGLTTYIVDNSYIRAASSSYTWQVKATVTDKVGTTTKTATVTTAAVLMDFLAGGTGMAIGKVAETPNLMESALPVQANNGIVVKNRLVTYYNTATGDCNTITDEWHLGGNGSANYPIVGSGIYWYVNTIFYAISPNKYAKQIAYGYGTTHQNRVFVRNCNNGSWGAWVEQIDVANAGTLIGGFGSLTSSTLVGTDTLLVSDESELTVPKKLTIDSLFAFFKLRTNYSATNVVNSSTLSVIDDYITIDANWTVSTLRIDRFGPMVSFYINVTRDVALGVGNITNDLICTILDSTLWPAIIVGFTNASGGDIMTGYIDQSGGVYISATRNGGTVLNIGVTYLI
jgi:hypothetical protein